MNTYTSDALVIGGGPAGATAAAVLAAKGHKVYVLEKDTFPRYHIGESLIPYCYFPLERIGMIDKIKQAGFVEKHSVQFVGVDGRSSQPFYFFKHLDHDAARSWQVERAVFDQMMLDNAREKGAEVFHQVKAKNHIKENGAVVGVTATGPAGEAMAFRAPITIDCTGRDGLTMTRNRWRVAEAKLKKHAVWTYFKGAKRDEGIDEGTTTVAYIEGKGWFWYIPLHNDMVSVGVVADKDYLFHGETDLEKVMWREIDKQPWIKERVEVGEQMRPVQATGDYSYRAQHIAADGVVLAGDAFSFLDPVFSSGVFLALLSGELVADAADQCLTTGNYSAEMFSEYARQFRHGIEVMRKIVYAFYDVSFNFKNLIDAHPNLHGDLTDALIGNVRKDMQPLFNAMQDFAELPDSLPHGLPKAAAV